MRLFPALFASVAALAVANHADAAKLCPDFVAASPKTLALAEDCADALAQLPLTQQAVPGLKSRENEVRHRHERPWKTQNGRNRTAQSLPRRDVH